MAGIVAATDTVPVKPGYKTTEFYITIIGLITGVLVALGYLTPAENITINSDIITIVGGIMSASSIISYSFSRAKAKK